MTQQRTICVDENITYQQQLDGTWVNLYSERVYDTAFMVYHFPWAFGRQHEECTCVDTLNDYAPFCPSCRARNYLAHNDNHLCGGEYMTEVPFSH